MKEPGVLVDYYTMRMVQNLRLQMMKLSDELISKGEKAMAINILDKTFEVMPIKNEQVPAGDICHYLCANYYEAGDTLKGNLIGKTLVELQIQKLKHYTHLEDEFVGYVWAEIGKSLTNLEMLREASLVDMPRSDMFEPDPATGGISFASKGILEGTDYDKVCASVRNLFVKNYSKKPNFFTNPQKFPVYYTQLWGGQLN